MNCSLILKEAVCVADTQGKRENRKHSTSMMIWEYSAYRFTSRVGGICSKPAARAEPKPTGSTCMTSDVLLPCTLHGSIAGKTPTFATPKQNRLVSANFQATVPPSCSCIQELLEPWRTPTWRSSGWAQLHTSTNRPGFLRWGKRNPGLCERVKLIHVVVAKCREEQWRAIDNMRGGFRPANPSYTYLSASTLPQLHIHIENMALRTSQ